jgi:two-component system, OmpR family, sensor histidine kinase QseC
MKQFSLYSRLLYMTMIPMILGFFAIGIHSYYSAYQEAENIYDAQLAHFAQVMGLIALHEVEMGDVTPKVIHMHERGFQIPYEKDFAYRVWLNNAVLMQSENSLDFAEKAYQSGFADKTINQQPWRFYVLHEGNLTIEVAEDYHIRQDLVKQVGLSILLPLLLLFPLLLCVIWFGLRRGVLPLRNLSSMIRGQTPESLNLMNTDKIPLEATPLVDAINHLITQVEEALDREKRFTRYAAHEMRTPLAALKTQIQVTLREKNETFRKELLQDVLAGVERATHLLEQLLILARAQQHDVAMQRVNLSDIAEGTATPFLVIAERKQQQLHIDIAKNIYCEGNAELLGIMLRNLLDNACAYSPVGANISLGLHATEVETFVLTVSNAPANIDEQQAQRMFEPFYRASNADSEGAGLGLAIVSWINKTHHFNVSHTLVEGCFTVQVHN